MVHILQLSLLATLQASLWSDPDLVLLVYLRDGRFAETGNFDAPGPVKHPSWRRMGWNPAEVGPEAHSFGRWYKLEC